MRRGGAHGDFHQAVQQAGNEENKRKMQISLDQPASGKSKDLVNGKDGESGEVFVKILVPDHAAGYQTKMLDIAQPV